MRTYHYRYQINGERKSISLKTKNQEEAKRKVKELLPVLKATRWKSFRHMLLTRAI